VSTPPDADQTKKAQSSAEPDLHLWKLPRGRHGLTPEVVARSQRERLLAAVVRVTAAEGYQTTSVADILKEAGVGRESFYRHFRDKEDCFIAANDALVSDLETKVGEAYEQTGAWPERIRNGLMATLDWFASNPELARVMLIEMGTVGPVASERFRETFRRFAVLLDDGPEHVKNAPGLPNLASIAGGAVFARVYEEVALGNTIDLSELLPQLTYELLLTYIGESAARKEQLKARKALDTR
jgi:AcrR family transcriptional regulator